MFMNYTNQEVARFLEKIAIAYELKNKNRFKIAAYENAADSIRNYPQNLEEIWQRDKKELDNIPGVGESILKKLDYLFTYHRYPPKVQALFDSFHPAIFVLTEIANIGPQNAKKLVKNLEFPKDKIKIINKLIDYAKKNKIASIPTFGKKSQELFLKNAKEYLGNVDRLPYETANKLATEIINYLKQKFPQAEIVALGSLRRQSPTVGDIDIAVCYPNSSEIIDYFVNYPKSYGTFDKGPKKASIKLKGNIRVDLMVAPRDSWGDLVQHFTGSKEHNIELRKYARKMGLSISEYGIKDLKTGKLYQFTNEKDLYKFLNYPYPEPEKR